MAQIRALLQFLLQVTYLPNGVFTKTSNSDVLHSRQTVKRYGEIHYLQLAKYIRLVETAFNACRTLGLRFERAVRDQRVCRKDSRWLEEWLFAVIQWYRRELQSVR
jgi:hypothetical protein